MQRALVCYRKALVTFQACLKIYEESGDEPSTQLASFKQLCESSIETCKLWT